LKVKGERHSGQVRGTPNVWVWWLDHTLTACMPAAAGAAAAAVSDKCKRGGREDCRQCLRGRGQGVCGVADRLLQLWLVL
jgi:hypothetical protein